jgi:predicted transcriptional regulator
MRHDINVRAPIFAVMMDTTLGHVVRVLESLHVHRVVVTDHRGVAVGIVSLSDVLAELVYEPEGYFGTYFDDAPATD